MNSRRRRAGPAAAALALAAGCHVEVPEPIYSACHALATGGWRAELAEYPHPEWRDRTKTMLQVSGEATVPAGGFALALDPGPLVDLNPPVQQVILRTLPPADGAAAQAVTTLPVSAAVPWRKQARSVEIRCGDGIIARIPEIAGAA